jgi:succinate dehydrogenase / fumarate reductase cytochrome b subunit
MSDNKTFLKTTIGKKVLMAATGLSLVGFLTSHLVGNFLLFDSIGGQEAFNNYANWLTTHPAIIPMEIGLVALFVLHIITAFKVTLAAKKARPDRYEVSKNLGKSTFASRTMVHTGSLILIFLVLHLVTFKFGVEYKVGEVTASEITKMEKEGKSKEVINKIILTSKASKLDKGGKTIPAVRDLYRTVKERFRDKLYSIIYILCMIGLGIHLCHGIKSAFQTLGLNHPKYNGFIEKVSCILAISFALGYSIFPIYFGFIAQ